MDAQVLIVGAGPTGLTLAIDLVDATAAAGEDTLDSFLQEIALLSDADSRSDEEGLVTLMTVHNAKGLEYPIVYIVGCEDGVFPHSRALDEGGLEEERRLFYVGVTRAKDELYLTYPMMQEERDQARLLMRPSRFLDELPTHPPPYEKWSIELAPEPGGLLTE